MEGQKTMNELLETLASLKQIKQDKNESLEKMKNENRNDKLRFLKENADKFIEIKDIISMYGESYYDRFKYLYINCNCDIGPNKERFVYYLTVYNGNIYITNLLSEESFWYSFSSGKFNTRRTDVLDDIDVYTLISRAYFSINDHLKRMIQENKEAIEKTDKDIESSSKMVANAVDTDGSIVITVGGTKYKAVKMEG